MRVAKEVGEEFGVKSCLLRSRQCNMWGSVLFSPAGTGQRHNQLLERREKEQLTPFLLYRPWALGRDRVRATSLVCYRYRIKRFPQQPSKTVCRVWDNSRDSSWDQSANSTPMHGVKTWLAAVNGSSGLLSTCYMQSALLLPSQRCTNSNSTVLPQRNQAMLKLCLSSTY